MRKATILGLGLFGWLLVPALLVADVYRWTDDQGQVHFGDYPPEGQSSEPLEIREPMRAVPLPDALEILQRPVRPQAEAADEGYTQIAITEPEDGIGVRANDGNVTARVELQPELDVAEGHRVVWLLNGMEAGEGASPLVMFEALDRGAYTLEARVVDAQDTILISSDAIEFNVLRASISREQQRQQRPQQFPSGGAPDAPRAPRAP